MIKKIAIKICSNHLDIFTSFREIFFLFFLIFERFSNNSEVKGSPLAVAFHVMEWL